MTWNISSWRAGLAPGEHVKIAIPEAERFTRGVYVYRLPPAFNADIDRAVSMKHGVFMKAERILHALISSLPQTLSASQASVLWVPLYTAALGTQEPALRENKKRRDIRQM